MANNIGRTGRTFQYADQDAYQGAYPEDFNADALFHVSVSVKRICLCLPYYKQCLHNIVIIHMKMQCLFIHNVVNSIFYHIYVSYFKDTMGRLWIWYMYIQRKSLRFR